MPPAPFFPGTFPRFYLFSPAIVAFFPWQRRALELALFRVPHKGVVVAVKMGSGLECGYSGCGMWGPEEHIHRLGVLSVSLFINGTGR